MGTFAVKSGRLWSGTNFIPNKEFVREVSSSKDVLLTLTEEDLIVPGGLVDMHAHLWAPPAVHSFGVAQEIYFAEGFSAALDAGTYGVNDWETADRYWREHARMQIKSFLSILPEGLTVFPPVTPTKPEDICADAYVEVIRRNPGRALGVKVQLGWLNYKSPESDRKLLELCREIADRTGTNMMVHISGQCMPAADSADMMARRDIITHPYSGFANTVLDENGRVLSSVFAAKERGVIFDVGYAGKHFSWEVFEKAYEQGLTFDTMGADLVTPTYKMPKSIVFDQYHMISGFLNFGLDADTVFSALTKAPAAYLGMDLPSDDGCVVLRKVPCETVFVDGQGGKLPGSFEYEPVAVLQNGAIIWCTERKTII